MKKRIGIAVLVIVLMLAGSVLAEGKVVRPKAPLTDITRLDNHYVLTDIHYEGNRKATLTLYEEERFSAEEMDALKAGDIILTEGKEVLVNSVMPDDEGYIFVNVGTDDERFFYKNGHGEYLQSGENDVTPLITLGTMQMTIEDNQIVLDTTNVDLGHPVLLTGADMIREMESGSGIGFESKNVYVLYGGDNYPWIVMRFYTPWQ